MISFVFLTNRAPSPLADELMFAGYQVYEALVTSEVFYLCEHHGIAAILIDADYEPRGIEEIRRHFLTFKLTANVTPEAIVRELSQFLLPTATVQ